MDEMADVIAQKTGLSHDQAKAAAQAALDYLMTKLPAPIAQQVKGALDGSGPAGLGDVAKGLGGVLRR